MTFGSNQSSLIHSGILSWVLYPILSGSATIVILTRLCRVISKAVIVVVNLINALLQNRHDVVKGAKTVRVVFAAGIGAVDGDDGIVAALEC